MDAIPNTLFLLGQIADGLGLSAASLPPAAVLKGADCTEIRLRSLDRALGGWRRLLRLALGIEAKL